MKFLRRLMLVLLTVALLFGAGRFFWHYARSYSARLDGEWVRALGGDESTDFDGTGLPLSRGRLLEIYNITERLGRFWYVRLAVEMLDFRGLTLAAATSSGEETLLFNAVKEKHLFPYGKTVTLEFIKTDENLRFVVEGSIYLQSKIGDVRVERLAIQPRKSSLRALDMQLYSVDENGREVLVKSGLYQRAPYGLWIQIVLTVLGLLVCGVVLSLELWPARRLRVRREAVVSSWLWTTAPIALAAGLLAGQGELVHFLKSLTVLWIFFRLRFWLLETGAFDATRTAKWRIVPFVLGLPMIALAVFRGAGSTGNAAIAGVATMIFVGGGLVLYARAMQMPAKQAMAVVGPAFVFLILSGLFVISDKPDSLGSLVLFLPLGGLFLTLPLSANRYRLRWYGAFMLGALVLLFFLSELGLRQGQAAAYLQPMGIGRDYQVDEDLFWAPKGLFSYGDDFTYRDHYRVTRIAFRGHEDATVEKPDGVERILVMGGSNVWGDGQPSNETTFVGQLEKRLRERGSDVQVLNGGVKGYNAFQVMVLLTKYALSYQPDLVVLVLMRNDINMPYGLYTYRELLQASDNDPRQVTRRMQSVFRYSLIYNGLTRLVLGLRDRTQRRWYDASAWKSVNPDEDFAANVTDMIHACRRAGAKVALVTEFVGEAFVYDVGQKRVEELHQAMHRVAKKEGVPILDAYKSFNETNDPLSWMLPEDPVHFNAVGHVEMAKMLEHFLISQGLVK